MVALRFKSSKLYSCLFQLFPHQYRILRRAGMISMQAERIHPNIFPLDVDSFLRQLQRLGSNFFRIHNDCICLPA